MRFSTVFTALAISMASVAAQTYADGVPVSSAAAPGSFPTGGPVYNAPVSGTFADGVPVSSAAAPGTTAIGPDPTFSAPVDLGTHTSPFASGTSTSPFASGTSTSPFASGTSTSPFASGTSTSPFPSGTSASAKFKPVTNAKSAAGALSVSAETVLGMIAVPVAVYFGL